MLDCPTGPNIITRVRERERETWHEAGREDGGRDWANSSVDLPEGTLACQHFDLGPVKLISDF